MVENVVQIKSEIMIDAGNSAKKHPIYEKYIWNSTTCGCENRKYLASIVISDYMPWNYRCEKTIPINRSSKHSSWWRRLEDVFCLRFQKTSSRRLQDGLIKKNIFALVIHLQKSSWSRPIYSSWPYVFRNSC